jgi:hypothetical protein
MHWSRRALFLACGPAISWGKGDPSTTIELTKEREKKTALGMIHLKGRVVLRGKHPEITDEVWHQARLEKGTLARDMDVRGLTIPANSRVSIDSYAWETVRPYQEEQVGISVILPGDIEMCGLTFTKNFQAEWR